MSEALAQEMARDPRVLVMGEDIARLAAYSRLSSGAAGPVWT